MAKKKDKIFEIACPDCGAMLKVDAATGLVVSHTPAPRKRMFEDLETAAKAMREQDERKESLFRQSVEAEKNKADLLEKKFAEAMRKAVGMDVDLCFDAHARIWAPYLAYELAEVLKPVRPLFLEEAIRPENMDSMAELRRRVQIPIATGEELYTKYQFHQLMSVGGADIVQPDICLAGGILEEKKIAAIAEAHYVEVAPHNPLGPLATLVNIHFAASTPNFLILEYHPDDESPRKDLVKGDTIVAKDGYLAIPDKPGWGYEMDEEAFKRMPGKPWHRGFSFRVDGAPDFV